MKLSDNALYSFSCFIGMIVFYMIPILKSMLGQPFPITSLIVAVAIGMAWGIVGSMYLGKYTEERRKMKK